jgi:hypothetical protein
MIKSGELRIHYTDIPERIKAYFGDRIKDQHELDTWDYDLRAQTLLHRDAAGYYEFAHKSLAEYFVAYKFAAELGCLAPAFAQTYCEAAGQPCPVPIEQKDITGLAETFGAMALTDERTDAVCDLLPGVMAEDVVGRLWEVIDKTRGKTPEKVKYAGGNAVTLLRITGESFVNADLARTVLTGADLYDTDLTKADLKGACLREADLSGCTLEATDLRGADLTGVRMEEMGAIRCVAWSPDGRYLASGGRDTKVRIWDTQTWKEIAVLGRHRDVVWGICWSSEGERIASVGRDKEIIIWRKETWKVEATLPAPGEIWCVQFNPKRQQLSVGVGSDVRIWEIATWMSSKLQRVHDDRVYSICYNWDGKQLATGSWDNTIAIWDARDGQFSHNRSLRGHKSNVISVSYNKDGTQLLSGSDDNTLLIWDLQTGTSQIMLQHTAHVRGIYSPNGQYIGIGSWGKDVQIWHADSLHRAWERSSGHKDNVVSICFSPDSCWFVTAGEDATIRIWDVTTGKCTKVLAVKMNCRGMKIKDAKGLDVEGYISVEGYRVSLRWWLKERGAVE